MFSNEFSYLVPFECIYYVYSTVDAIDFLTSTYKSVACSVCNSNVYITDYPFV